MRLQTSKSKNAISFYIVESIYVKGKRSNKIVEKLGTLEQIKEKIGDMDPYEWGRQRAKELTEAKNAGKEIDVNLTLSPETRLYLNSKESFNCGYLFLQQIYYGLGLDSICKDISSNYDFDYDLNDIVSKLVFSRMLTPCSKRASFEYFSEFLEDYDFKLHDIYRSLDVINENSDFILSQLYLNNTTSINRNTKVLYYDCTNFFFEIDDEDGFRNYGYSKEHRPNPIVQMGLFLDGNGIPLSFCINPGNQNEQLSLKPLEKKIISDFGISKFVVCTDCGLSSTANRKFNNFGSRFYITSQSVKKLKGFLKKWALSPEGWKVGDGNTVFNLNDIDEDMYHDKVFFKERWINENGLKQKLFITFSFKYRDYSRHLREIQINRAKKLISKGKCSIKRKGQNDVRRFIQDTNVTKDGEVCDKTMYSLDEKVIFDESQFDGFYAVCTNLEATAEQIISINRNRWEIEQSFRIMKSEFKARPVYLSREGRIKAHFMICFLALLILRILENRLNYKFTVHDILTQLSRMKVFRKRDLYIPTYTRTELTDKLHEISGLDRKSVV